MLSFGRALRFAIPLLVLAPTLGCFQGSRRGRAEVRAPDNVPCFTVHASELRAQSDLRIWAVSVSDVTQEAAAPMWTTGSDEPRPVTPDTCVRYGEPPPGFSKEPATPLQPRRLYHVHVNAKPPRNRDNTMGYDARFCLAPLPSGGTRVIPMEVDNRKGVDPACAP